MDVFAPGAKKEITLLCVSDTHQHFENISKVMAQVARTDIDYVIHSGDWTDITVAEQVDPLKVAEAEASISSQLSQLEAIVKPVYYIPGNHDPKTLRGRLPVSLLKAAHRRTHHPRSRAGYCRLWRGAAWLQEGGKSVRRLPLRQPGQL